MATARLSIALLALTALVGCPEAAKPAEDPEVIATVNGEVISRASFDSELGRELQAMEGETPATPEQVAPFKKALLQTAIERTALLQAAKSANVLVTPEEVDRQVLRLSSDYPAEGFDAALASGQLSLTELKRKTAAQLTIEKLFQEQVYPRVAVTEEEIRHYFEEHTLEFQEPEQVRCAQIVVKGLDEAKRLLAQLRSGKKFSDLARRYSLSADAKVGGDLGFFPRGVMPPQFDEVAFKLGVGQISEVVATDFGFHLFKVLEKRGARKSELTEVRRKVEERLLKERRTEAQAAYLKGLLDKAEVRINEQTFLAASGKSKANPAPDER
jgi:peptidyl-prolyl cis-trans isomerase C/foldase protein PrsA